MLTVTTRLVVLVEFRNVCVRVGAREQYLDSDADEQLIIYIPFTGDVKLKSICVMGGEDDMHPTKMLAWKASSFITSFQTQYGSSDYFENASDLVAYHARFVEVFFNSITFATLTYV